MTNHVRVSEILAQFKDYSVVHPKVLSEKCQIGTEVHTNIHVFKNGGFPVFDTFAVRNPVTSDVIRWEERGEGYYNSYMQFEKAKNPKFEVMEQRYYDDNLMITGQIDALMSTDDLPVLVDFKCSYNADKEIWGMQAHYYKHLLEHNGIKIADYFYFLKLDKKGKKPQIVEIKYDENVLSRCISEAILFWENKSNAKCFS